MTLEQARNENDSQQTNINNEIITMKKTSEANGKTPRMMTLIVCLGVLPLLYAATGCTSTKSTAYSSPPEPSLVGPAGPAGPAGLAGEQGPTGWTGAPGATMTGPRGAAGPAGPTGIRGPTGATGEAGDVEVGQAGVAGRSGPAGAQGDSAAGFAGQTGPAGPAGAQGARGDRDAQGSALVGPTGPAGVRGPAGVEGVSGETGLQGSTTAGVAGPTGASGTVGEQGSIERQATKAGRCDWTLDVISRLQIRSRTGCIRPSDTSKVSDIALYMKQNPSLQIGIDTFVDASNQDLRNRRVNAVRVALIQDGVPTVKIGTSSFGNPNSRSDARVEVLIATAAGYTAAQN